MMRSAAEWQDMYENTEKRTIDGRRIGEKPIRVLPETEQKLKMSAIEALNRTVHLKDLQIADIAKVHKGWRSSHLAGIRGLRTEEFGFQSLLFACEKLDVIPVCHFIPAANWEFDGHLAPLFKVLHSAGAACDAAAPSIGTRSYPLAAVTCQTAGLTCFLAIDAIRRSHQYSKREIPGFRAQLDTAVDLLKRIEKPSPSLRFALKRLGEADKALADYADQKTPDAVRHHNYSTAGSHATAC